MSEWLNASIAWCKAMLENKDIEKLDRETVEETLNILVEKYKEQNRNE